MDSVPDLVKFEDAKGLSLIHHAIVYLSHEFHVQMTFDQARSNLGARALLVKCSNVIFREYGCPITNEEIEGARIIERNMSPESLKGIL